MGPNQEGNISALVVPPFKNPVVQSLPLQWAGIDGPRVQCVNFYIPGTSKNAILCRRLLGGSSGSSEEDCWLEVELSVELF